VQMNALGLTDIAPTTAPDIYPYVLNTMAGRMPRPAAGATVEIMSQNGMITALEISISDDTSATTRWASQYLKAVDYQIMSSRDNTNDLEKKIVELSVKYRVLSKYTAWLAVDYSRKTEQVIVQTLSLIPDFDSDSQFVQVAYSRFSVFDSLSSQSMTWDLSVTHNPSTSGGKLDHFLKMLRRPTNQGVLDEATSTTQFKRLKKLIRFLASLFRWRNRN